MTGSDRIFNREPQSVRRLTRTFFKSLSVVDLAEPLVSLDENQAVTLGMALLREKNLSVLGVRRAGSPIGWVRSDDLRHGLLGDHVHPFQREELLDESAGVATALVSLGTAEQVFVEWLGEVAGVITHRDLQKAPLRMWLFGAITLLDTNLTWAIEELYPANGWRSQVTRGRFEKAAMLHAERQRNGTDCHLIDCLQIKDKADILVSNGASLDVLGLKSRKEANRLTRDIEKLRNHLAHAQELERGHLATAARLASYINSILRAEVAQRIVEVQRKRNANNPLTSTDL
jgi:hypothetical protein